MAVIFKSAPAFTIKLAVRSDSPSWTPLFFWIQGKQATSFQEQVATKHHQWLELSWPSSLSLKVKRLDSWKPWSPGNVGLAKYWSSLKFSWASLLAQLVKNMPAMQETLVWFLGWEDPLEKRKVSCLTHFKAQLLTLPCIMGSKSVCLWVWVPRARLHAGCRCLGSTVCWLHRGIRLSLQTGRPRCAERGVWHFCCGRLWTFHPHFSPKRNLLISRMWDFSLGIFCTIGNNQA